MAATMTEKKFEKFEDIEAEMMRLSEDRSSFTDAELAAHCEMLAQRAGGIVVPPHEEESKLGIVLCLRWASEGLRAGWRAA